MGDAGAVTDPGNPDALLPSLDPRMFVTTSGAGTEKTACTGCAPYGQFGLFMICLTLWWYSLALLEVCLYTLGFKF